jgi:hypothetical protein
MCVNGHGSEIAPPSFSLFFHLLHPYPNINHKHKKQGVVHHPIHPDPTQPHPSIINLLIQFQRAQASRLASTTPHVAPISSTGHKKRSQSTHIQTKQDVFYPPAGAFNSIRISICCRYNPSTTKPPKSNKQTTTTSSTTSSFQWDGARVHWRW